MRKSRFPAEVNPQLITGSPQSTISLFQQKLTDYGLLVKFKLNLWVVFSAGMAFLTAAGNQLNGASLALLAIGGFLVTGAANAINQVLEREYDQQMKRTADRPLAAGRMTVSEAIFAAGLMSLAGIACLSSFNALTGFLGMVSLISYAFIYTPMKRMSSLAVAVGAIPGALPVMIGVVAFSGTLTPLAWFLFGVQFLWQFPHFWAIAWATDEDYKRAGFQLLPTKNGQLDGSIGRQSWIFCLLMVVNAATGFLFGEISLNCLVFLSVLSLGFGWFGWNLQQKQTRKAALGQMFASFAYLPLALIAIWIDSF